MTINGVFSESFTLAVTFAASPDTQGTTSSTAPGTTQPTSTSPVPPAVSSAVADTAQISPAADALSKVDANGDGAVAKHHGHHHHHHGRHGGGNIEQRFASLDANGDGAISKDEFTAAFKNAAQPAGGVSTAPATTSTTSTAPVAPDAAGVGQTLAAVDPSSSASQSAPSSASFTFVFSFTAIVQYQSVSGGSASPAVGTQLNAAA